MQEEHYTIASTTARLKFLPKIEWSEILPRLKTAKITIGLNSSKNQAISMVVFSQSVLSHTFIQKNLLALNKLIDRGITRIIASPLINNKKLGILMGKSYNIMMISLL